MCSTHLYLSSLVSSFCVCSSSCLVVTCSAMTSFISPFTICSLEYNCTEQEHINHWRHSRMTRGKAHRDVQRNLNFLLVANKIAWLIAFRDCGVSGWVILPSSASLSWLPPHAAGRRTSPSFLPSPRPATSSAAGSLSLVLSANQAERQSAVKKKRQTQTVIPLKIIKVVFKMCGRSDNTC